MQVARRLICCIWLPTERYVRTSTTLTRAGLGYLASASVPTGFCEWNPWKPILTAPRDIHSTSHYLLGVCTFKGVKLVRTVVLLLTHRRDDVRYNYKHSILCTESTPAQGASRGQRLSVMVRVRFQLLPILQAIMNKLLRLSEGLSSSHCVKRGGTAICLDRKSYILCIQRIILMPALATSPDV